MTIEQTVEIPADHRVMFEFLAPGELPPGKATVKLTLTPLLGNPDQKTSEWVNPLRGIAKDSKLTLGRFREMQQEDLEHENEIDKCLWENE
jgi:hypothetical protein